MGASGPAAEKRPHANENGNAGAKRHRGQDADAANSERKSRASLRAANLKSEPNFVSIEGALNQFPFGEDSPCVGAEDGHAPFALASWEPADQDHTASHQSKESEAVVPSWRAAQALAPIRLPVVVAAAQGKLKEVQAMLQSDGDIDLLDVDSEGYNALHAAITEAKHPDSVLLVKTLLEHEPLLATAVRADDFKYSPLISLVAGAAVRGQQADTDRACQIGELLLSYGADPMYRDAEGGWTFLHWSVDMTNSSESGVAVEKTPRRVRERLETLLSRLFEHDGLKTRLEELIMIKDFRGRDAMDFILLNQDDELASVLGILWQKLGTRKVIEWLQDVPRFTVPLPGSKRGKQQKRCEYLEQCMTMGKAGVQERAFPNCWALARDFLSTEGNAWVPLRT